MLNKGCISSVLCDLFSTETSGVGAKSSGEGFRHTMNQYLASRARVQLTFAQILLRWLRVRARLLLLSGTLLQRDVLTSSPELSGTLFSRTERSLLDQRGSRPGSVDLLA